MSTSNQSLVAYGANPAPLIDLVAASDYAKPIKIGLVVLAVSLGGFGAWATLAPLDAAVAAHGTLVVESKRKVVQHLEGGIVRQILVRDGDRVRAGQSLIALDGTRAQAMLTASQSLFDAARARSARLLAERDERDGVIFPEDLSLRATDPKVDDLLVSERRQFEERRKSRLGQKGILEQRVQQLQAQQSGMGAQENAKQRQARALREELVGLRELAAKGFYARNRVSAMERELAAMEGERGSAAYNGIGVEKSIAEARMQIIQIDQDFRKEVSPNSRQSRII
jgi:HlyD family type I secretion membrane fusion protein